MSFAPIIPFGGYTGWRYLNATLDAQTDRYAQTAVNARDMQYFKDNIGSVTSAADLVSDYQLLRVALGAFGLQDDLPNRAFITRVLSDGTTADDALANRLADKRYKTFSDAFGFGSSLPPKTQSLGFAQGILDRFARQDFERAVGTQNEDMRLALTAQRELPEIADRGLAPRTAWLTILGTPPVRRVFEVALGLPDSIGSIDLDQQVDAFQKASDRILGHSDVARFSSDGAVDDLLRNFTIRAQLASGPSPLTPGVAALTLLQSMA